MKEKGSTKKGRGSPQRARIMQVLFSNIEHIQSHTFEYEGEQEKERERKGALLMGDRG